MRSLVSIIIPCYNAEAWLGETLESALSQTWPRTEIIVVDDGSTDNSLALAQRFESEKVKVISRENHGASAARNQGLEIAQGDYIQFLDADDLLAPDKIERQVQLCKTLDSEQLISGAWARFYRHPQEAAFTPEPLWSNLSSVEWLVCSWNGNWMMHPAAWLLPRSITEKAGFWDESLSLNDDGEYFCRAVLASKYVTFCNEAKSYYRSGITTSLSGRKSDKALHSLYKSLNLNAAHLLACDNNPLTRQACAITFQRFAYDVYPSVPDLRLKAEAKVRALGGADVQPSGGPVFKAISSVLGWKLSKRVQGLYRRRKHNFFN